MTHEIYESFDGYSQRRYRILLLRSTGVYTVTNQKIVLGI